MKIFDRLCEVLRTEKGAVLATIISASGSTPAPSQSKMLIRTKGDGSAIGTVGGGCLDQNILLSLSDAAFTGGARILTFHLNDDDSDAGLTCGGTVHVLVEELDESFRPIYEHAVRRLSVGNGSYILTRVAGAPCKSLLDEGGAVIEGSKLPADILKEIGKILRVEKEPEGSRQVKSASGEYVLEYIEPVPRLIIFGGGHVGKIVSRCGAIAGFSVTIVDDREQYANRERFPEAENILCEDFEEAVETIQISPGDFIVIVTRGHKHDERILGKVAAFYRNDIGPKYIGMIGSKRKIQLSYERLIANGVSKEVLAQVHAPVGLDIGAETAEEIGVSIVAELIAVRRRSGQKLSFRA